MTLQELKINQIRVTRLEVAEPKRSASDIESEIKSLEAKVFEFDSSIVTSCCYFFDAAMP